jgi:hypothetical protein
MFFDRKRLCQAIDDSANCLFAQTSREYSSKTRVPSICIDYINNYTVFALPFPSSIQCRSKMAVDFNGKLSFEVYLFNLFITKYYRSDYIRSNLSSILSILSSTINAFVFIAFTNRLRHYLKKMIRKTSRSFSSSSDAASPRILNSTDAMLV